ncbi:MAG: hypothetical protein KKG40_02690, partial [Gammaproteobacteria bacterium]|nr:hypothetical protein [Gammaproteobacteria bacterium]
EQTACLSGTEQTTLPVDQQGSLPSMMQGNGQPAHPLGCIKKTIGANRHPGTAPPQPSRLI